MRFLHFITFTFFDRLMAQRIALNVSIRRPDDHLQVLILLLRSTFRLLDDFSSIFLSTFVNGRIDAPIFALFLHNIAHGITRLFSLLLFNRHSCELLEHPVLTCCAQIALKWTHYFGWLLINNTRLCICMEIIDFLR